MIIKMQFHIFFYLKIYFVYVGNDGLNYSKYAHILTAFLCVLLDDGYCCSVTQSRPTLRPRGLQHAGFPVLHHLLKIAQTHVHWVRDASQLLPSATPFSSCLQYFAASGSFPMSQFIASDSQSIGASASASVLPKNIQDWFPLKLTGLFLWSKGLSRVFSNATVQKHQFFSAQPSLEKAKAPHSSTLA